MFFAHDPLDVFHHHNGIVDQQPDSQNHRKHGQGIDRITKQCQHTERAQQHHRYGDRGNQGSAQVLHEQEHDQHNQHDCLAQRLHHFPDRQADEGRRVIGNDRFQLHLRRVKRFQLLQFGLDRFTDAQRIRAGRQLNAHRRRWPAVECRVDVITLASQFYPRHIAQQHDSTVAGRLDDHLLELLGRLQLAASADSRIQLLAFNRRQSPQLACRDFGVLRLQGRADVGRHQCVLLQPGRVQPDTHRVSRTQRLHVADTIYPAELIEQRAGNVIADLRTGHPFVVGGQGDQHQKVGTALGHRQAFALHTLRQARFGLLQFVLHLHLRHIRVGACGEGQADARAARRAAGGRHISQPVEPFHLLLDDLGDGVFDGLGRCASVGGGDFYRRRRDIGVLLE
ncbi:hypothetical protein ALO98_200392 [Pseudomonas syringae pv. tagetis]|nr:hypothetical protein ALO98_200392 [Pseudomonas syringae pv. tagetis]